MDRYESLLENLKMTQRHGLDAVANRLNDFVTRLDDLVETMKAAVQDALPSDADELFPIAELESGLAELSVAAREAPRGSAGVSLDNLRLLDGARSQGANRGRAGLALQQRGEQLDRSRPRVSG